MLVFSAKCLLLSAGVVLSLDTASDSSNGSGRHFEPQVAMLCPEKGELANKLFHNKFLSSSGKWESDTDMKATCKKDKVEILEYCKKVYPERDITNIVESSHYVKVSNWCKLGQKKCRSGSQQWVKPYRCLEGPFQSDALLVPEHCLFDHIHNQTRCWNFDQWNTTAAAACGDRSMKLRSFAMLLPCGIDVFSGVEFVCCPARKIRKERVTKEEKMLASAWPDELKLQQVDEDTYDDDLDDEYDDEYEDDDHEDDKEESSSTTTTTTPTTTTTTP